MNAKASTALSINNLTSVFAANKTIYHRQSTEQSPFESMYPQLGISVQSDWSGNVDVVLGCFGGIMTLQYTLAVLFDSLAFMNVIEQER